MKKDHEIKIKVSVSIHEMQFIMNLLKNAYRSVYI